MIEKIKNRLIKNKIQFIEINKEGILLNSENNLFTMQVGESIYDVDPVFEAIRYYFDDTSRSNFQLSCINLEIGEAKGIYDIIIDVFEDVVVLTIVDFTSHYQISNTLSQERNESVIQSQILREREEFKNRFLANTSHELRTPLSTIMGFATILQRTDVTLDQMHSLDVIKTASEQLKNLIDDILDISKIEMGNLSIDKDRFNFNNFLGHIKDSYSEKFKSKDIRFILKSDKTIPQFLVGDKYRLRQILGNVIKNAFEFTDQGRVSVIAKPVNLTKSNITIAFIIKDTGIGIELDKIDSIFESFTQIDFDSTRGGTGLGLSIVKNLINLMDGEIEVVSKLNKGSTFTVTLNFKIDEDQTLDKPKEITIEKKYKGKKYNVLIAEDSELNQLLLMKIIVNRGGYYFDIANNGDQVIELLHANKYDLILMDLKMPKMDGYDTTRFIRQSTVKEFKDIPIIAVTAKVSPLERDKCISLGMTDYVGKPFEEEELLSKMETILKQKAN